MNDENHRASESEILAGFGITTAEIGPDGRPIIHAEPAPPPDYFEGSSPLALDDYPPYLPEDENPDILIRGRWLERGGSAFIVSTAGTGKSIHSLQLALCMTAGKTFSGLTPRVPLRFWIFQTEDSPSRIAIDRDDILAELAEQYPDTDWRAVAKQVKFVPLAGKVGADFLGYLDEMLTIADLRGERPDVVVLNPLMSFIGGPISDGNYITPFLRGGVINRISTPGLQFIIERHRVGLLAYHHTPKPPSEKEVDAWLKSPFPEYQGAGSSDITNWGRSFITMMRVPEHRDMVCLTAGKNGGDLGWREIGGASRMYLAYSLGESVTGSGRGRHAWRELSDEEMATVGGAVMTAAQEARRTIAAGLAQTAHTFTSAVKVGNMFGLRRAIFRTEWKYVTEHIAEFGLSCWTVDTGRNGRDPKFYGTDADARAAAELIADDIGDRNLAKCLSAAKCTAQWHLGGDPKVPPAAYTPFRGYALGTKGRGLDADTIPAAPLSAETATDQMFDAWLQAEPDAQPIEEVLF